MKSIRLQTAFAAAWLAAGCLAPSLLAQEVLLQEGFNTDGEASNPKRYTMTGRDLYEPDRIRAELSNFDQKGPIYWEHNFKVSYVGNPTIPGRRAIWGWRGTDTSTATEDFLKLFDSTVNWLLAGKKNATIVIHPNIASMQGLADRLTSQGHTVLDDDSTTYPNEADQPGDLFVHGPGASNPSRFVILPKPVLVANSPDYDDMLVGSIGTSLAFEPGQATIAAPGHPAAGGKTGSFDAVTGSQTFELIGSYLPTNATTVATITRIVPPSVGSLADVDAMVAGTKTHEETAGTATALDFSDGSPGQWAFDNGVPGGYAGNWGLVSKGKIAVGTAGTYRFALGSDDGARLSIDLDKNGITAADLILEDAGPHAHQIVYANVAFAASGTYDFEIRSYNSAGGGSLELSVGITEGTIPDDDLTSGYWEVIGTDGAVSPVKLSGSIAVTGYKATGPDVERHEPFLVTLNGPNDTPPGTFYDGGPISGYEGAGFLGAAGLNKWTYPNGLTYRAVTLNPVDVTGKKDVKLTVALAATVVDFEDSDIIDVVIYPDGPASEPVILAHFRGVQNAIQPWLADQKANYVRRLTRQFSDFTYDVPATAKNLIVEIRVATTWWTEIAAVDNIRVTAGTTASSINLAAPKLVGGEISMGWTGGQAPYLVQWTSALGSPWINLHTTSGTSFAVPVAGDAGFFRVQGNATGSTVKMYKAILTGAAEVPAISTTGQGAAVFAVDGGNISYYVSYADLSSDATAGHIHGEAAATATAGVQIPFTASGPLGKSGLFAGSAAISPAQKTMLDAGLTYANVHTTVNKGGEIRGQISAAP